MAADSWVAFLKRQQKTILARLGAGRTPSFDLFNMERWVRECASDTEASPHTAQRFMERLQGECADAYDPLAPVQSIKAVYADHISRFEPDRTFGVEGAYERGDHLLYKLFDAAGTVLYVGITSRGPQRLVEHHRTKSWFTDVDTILFERFLTRENCAAREVTLIRELDPVFNVQHKQAA